ncbi:hypothetical protein CDV55_103249 [Aspergillus turcosus]|nr:hypothetical protein CDV55_103249 [Aspergillus turcosus]
MENPSSAQLALTGIYPPTPLQRPSDLKTAIENKKEALKDGSDEDSYLSFSGVTPERFQYIESHRDSLEATRVRFTYFADIETLIVKVPSEPHEGSHLGIANEIRDILRMNSRVSRAEVWAIGSTRYRGNSSSKESDSGYRNNNLRPQAGAWPHWVIEAGMTESLERLHTDASWWINNSNGEVRLVILAWIRPRQRFIKIES